MRLCTLLIIGVVIGFTALGLRASHAIDGDRVVLTPQNDDKVVMPQQRDYLGVKSLDEAVTVLRRQLADSHSPVLPLVTKDALRAALVTSIEGTKRANAKAVRESSVEVRRVLEASAEHFDKVVAPIYLSVLKEEQWPNRAYFQSFQEGSSHNVRLMVDTRTADGTGYSIAGGPKLTGYGLPVLLVQFGDPGPAEHDDGTLTTGTRQ